MKFKVLMLSALAAMFAFVSCEDDNGGGGNLEPVLILDGSGDFIANDKTVTVGDSLQFRVSGSENPESRRNLDRIVITRTFNNDPQIVLDSSLSGSTLDPITLLTNAVSEPGEERFRFELFDRDDEVASTTVTITTEGEAIPFAEKDGVFYHILGSLRGSFDLVADQLRSASESDDLKDLMNNDVNNDGSTRTFTGSWEAGNTTMFKPASGTYNYDNANAQNTQFDYNVTQTLVTATSGIDSPEAGDVFIARLRGEDVFAAIRIVSVEPDFSEGTGANRGRITFTYKKDTASE